MIIDLACFPVLSQLNSISIALPSVVRWFDKKPQQLLCTSLVIVHASSVQFFVP
jgi:hypothetical protein